MIPYSCFILFCSFVLIEIRKREESRILCCGACPMLAPWLYPHWVMHKDILNVVFATVLSLGLILLTLLLARTTYMSLGFQDSKAIGTVLRTHGQHRASNSRPYNYFKSLSQPADSLPALLWLANGIGKHETQKWACPTSKGYSPNQDLLTLVWHREIYLDNEKGKKKGDWRDSTVIKHLPCMQLKPGSISGMTYSSR